MGFTGNQKEANYSGVPQNTAAKLMCSRVQMGIRRVVGLHVKAVDPPHVPDFLLGSFSRPLGNSTKLATR